MSATDRFRPSVTVAAVIAHAGRYLLVEEETPEGLMLNNPAGHLELGETPIEAVVREALEETMRDFVPTSFLGVYLARFVRPARLEDVTYVRLAFSGSVGEEIAGRTLDEGICRTLWMSEAELAACTDRHRSPLVLQCVQDHAAGRRLPLETVFAHASLQSPLMKG
ncbi:MULTISPECIES: NUDIX domain-containing protein [unclassified Roseateles]|uniref:NUDIX domain-containing protein n=1 Tax=unclassified Roseateles TaxID=2626991 RepID=UPI0006F2015F|nr:MULTISPECIES: NUDIX hydrolase [unclassified Roseateles]KQW45654.1 NUDIX hydrolase [Pelomonas sp. Root405]KRA72498.1 NUDIX hydrolase [Pelomonas sp. Root662]